MVGHELNYPDDFKGAKVSPPEDYNGKNDIEVFDNWLRSVLRYFQLTKMCGPDYDPIRVTHVGNYLKDTAAIWFRNTVENMLNPRIWTFQDTIVELLHRFVHGSSAQKAKIAYENVRYNRRDRVHAYYMELELKSKRLIELPDAYTMKTRFIDGLPTDIMDLLIGQEHMTAEHNTLQELVDAVYRIEESKEALDRLTRVRDRTLGQSNPGLPNASRTSHQSKPASSRNRFQSTSGTSSFGL